VKDFVQWYLLKRDGEAEKLADQLVDELRVSIDPSRLPEDLQRRILPGHDIASLTMHVLREYTLKLIRVIVDCEESTTMNATPFSFAIKDWIIRFVNELMAILSQALGGSVSDAALVVKFFLQERLDFVSPEFAQMGANMIISSMMQTYTNSQLSFQQQLQSITRDPSTWNDTISTDELRQANQTIQRPFSDKYLEGAPLSKKRKDTKLMNIHPETLMSERLSEAMKSVGVSSRKHTKTNNDNRENPVNNNAISNGHDNDDMDSSFLRTENGEEKNGNNFSESDATSLDSKEGRIIEAANRSDLSKRYLKKLRSDIRRRVQSDPDFDSSKNPHLTKWIKKEKK